MPGSRRPEREHESDRLVSETTEGELERGSRRSVEPLNVVHDHHHGSDTRALAEEGQEGRGNGTTVEWRRRLLSQQRDGQGAPLGRGKPPCSVIVDAFQQVTKPSERQPRFVVPGSAAKHLDRSAERGIDYRVQQGALADTGGPIDDESARPCVNIRDESLQRSELGLPSYDPFDAVRRGLMPPCSQQRNRLEPASGGHEHPQAVLAGRATRITFPATRRRSWWPNGEGGT